MKKYILMFVESIPPFKEKLEQAVAADDFAEIAKQVHAMKPKLVMMGMKEAQLLANEIEQIVKEKSNVILPGKISALNKLCEDAVSEFSA